MKKILIALSVLMPLLAFGNGEIISPNMNLVVPAVGVTIGPEWAGDINTSLGLIDAHDHSPGKGVQITPAGLNINADLTIQSHNLTNAESVDFTPQTSPTSNGSVYVNGVDLYYVDENGNNIRLTQAGSIVGTSGSISNLTPPASASYNSGTSTFVWQSAVNTSANLDAACLVQRDLTSGSNGITICPPSGLSSNYSITWPGSLPAQQNVATIDQSGNISDVTWDQVGQNMTSVGADAIANSRTRGTASGTVGVGGIAQSASSGNFGTSSTSPVNVTNLSVTITTSGRPVDVFLQPDGSGVSYLNANADTMTLKVLRGGTPIASYLIKNQTSNDITYPPSVFFMDAGIAGSASTYTYTVQIQSGGGGGVGIAFATLNAYEL
jgi:hypothetical protein